MKEFPQRKVVGTDRFIRLSDTRANANMHLARRYFSMTPQAMRSPEFPDGSLIRSSAFA